MWSEQERGERQVIRELTGKWEKQRGLIRERERDHYRRREEG